MVERCVVLNLEMLGDWRYQFTFLYFPTFSISQIDQDPTQKAHNSQLRIRINRFYLSSDPTLAHAMITRCEEWCQDPENQEVGP